jgi:hypothetical protein
MNGLILPVGEHHQAIFVFLVRFDRFFEQVDLVTATLEVHVASFPWFV